MNIDYDFIEIGTSCFDTLIEKAKDHTVGISIDPVKVYIDGLPNKLNVKKIWAAIVRDSDPKDLDLYFVTEENIKKYGLGDFMRGCNSIGKPHDFHLNYHPSPKKWAKAKNRNRLATRDLVSEGIVEKVKVPCLTYKQLMESHSVGKVNFLKIDTEGYDCKILNDMIDFYINSNRLIDLPVNIQFESNVHTDAVEVENTKNKLKNLGYRVTEEGQNTYLTKS